MKKFFLPFLLSMYLIFRPATILASSNLEVSNTADFSSETLNFNGGDNIFIRIQTSTVGSRKSQLNLRDNQYNLVNSFRLERDGEYYKVVISAPYIAGYYSLEAKVESEGSSTTSVKTIKVGNVANANIKVNVNSRSGSSEVMGESEKKTSGESASPSLSPVPKQSSFDSSEDYVIGPQSSKKGIADYLSSIFKEIIEFLWPFD